MAVGAEVWESQEPACSQQLHPTVFRLTHSQTVCTIQSHTNSQSLYICITFLCACELCLCLEVRQREIEIESCEGHRRQAESKLIRQPYNDKHFTTFARTHWPQSYGVLSNISAASKS